MLVGIGRRWIANWWWLGIRLAIRCELAAECFINGQIAQAVGVFALFFAASLGIAIVQDINISWQIVVRFALIIIGLVGVFWVLAGR
jgi:hypothetical protein